MVLYAKNMVNPRFGGPVWPDTFHFSTKIYHAPSLARYLFFSVPSQNFIGLQLKKKNSWKNVLGTDEKRTRKKIHHPFGGCLAGPTYY